MKLSHKPKWLEIENQSSALRRVASCSRSAECGCLSYNRFPYSLQRSGRHKCIDIRRPLLFMSITSKRTEYRFFPTLTYSRYTEVTPIRSNRECVSNNSRAYATNHAIALRADIVPHNAPRIRVGSRDKRSKVFINLSQMFLNTYRHTSTNRSAT